MINKITNDIIVCPPHTYQNIYKKINEMIYVCEVADSHFDCTADCAAFFF